MQLGSLTRPELIFPALDAPDRDTLLRSVADRLESSDWVSSGDVLYQKLLEREELESTALGGGVAIPHCKLEGLDDVLVAVAVLRQAIDFAAADGSDVRVFFFIVSPASSPVAHLQCLAAISKWVKSAERVQGLLELDDAAAMQRFLSQSAA